MMQRTTLTLPYGDTQLCAEVPGAKLLGVFAPRASDVPADEYAVLRAALDSPIGTPRLCEMARPGQKVVIVTSDLTRPCPSDHLLVPVLEELGSAGVPDRDVTVVVALGLHRPMTARELADALGPNVVQRFEVINHDPNRTVAVGVTSSGTPVEIFAPVVEADMRVCLGNVEFHYFAGYSGGAKAIFPGCASRATVTANHRMMVRPEATAGRIEGNPVRADIEEGVALLGVDFILNVISGEHRRIIEAVAGDVTSAHRRGCELVAQRGFVQIPRRADIVIVSAGGYPKDVNLYQAQKALDHAAHAVRAGGTIILVAECREGLGNRTFEAWMRTSSCPDDLLRRIQREFVLGGHKAAAIAAVEKRASVYLISQLPEESALACGMAPYDDLEMALHNALEEANAGAGLIVLPQGGSVLPVVPGNQ